MAITDKAIGGGFSQPGARSTRQETLETEVKMPVLQALVRSGVDTVAILLIFGAMAILGRWAIWAIVALLFYSEYYEIAVDRALLRLYGPAAIVVEWGARLLRWLWPFFGYPVLRVFFPLTWTMQEVLWQRSIVEFEWPFVHALAALWALPLRPGLRLILLVVCLAPLFTWRTLRDRMKWSIEEFTPFGPIDAAEQGIDPRKWGPKVEPPLQNNLGVIIEKTDYNPHVERVAEGVYISNGTGHLAIRVDMRWVTDEQWERVAHLLVVEGRAFSEETLGRGIVFSTHGVYDEIYKANLGYRFFKDQMIECGYAQYRNGHPNTGVELTTYGIDFLRRRFIDVDGAEDDNDPDL